MISMMCYRRKSGYTGKRNKIFVNIYFCDRVYGGPEEGGWYYDAGMPLTQDGCPMAISKAFTGHTSLMNHLRKVRSWADKMNEMMPEKWSVLSRGVIEVRVEEKAGQAFPAEVPYYC